MDAEQQLKPTTPDQLPEAPTLEHAAAGVTIRSLEEWNAIKELAGNNMVLLQCGSPVCVRCPEFTTALGQLKKEFQFEHVYVNTHDAEEDLLEELQVSKLPAYLLVKGKATWSKQNATSYDVSLSVARNCSPVFTCDADF